MRCKLFAILSIVASAFIFSACCSDTTCNTMAPRETNVFGLYTYSPESYAATGPNTLAINTDELSPRKEYTGDKTTLLWGLFTLKDY